MAAMETAEVIGSHQQQERVGEIRSTLFDNAGDQNYMERVREMMGSSKSRLLVDIGDLRDASQSLAKDLIESPFEVLPAFEQAVKEVVSDEDPSYFSRIQEDKKTLRKTADRDATIKVGFEGAFGAHDVSPRTLTSTHMHQLVKVEGIVTKCSMVRPKVAHSVHFCPATKAFHHRQYRDATSLTGAPTGSVYPSKDEEGNPLETEFGLSTYRDHQTLTIQEMPERAPLGQLPRSVDVICDEDLVDVVKPGDRVAIVGIYRALAGASKGTTSGLFRCVILANNVVQLRKQISATAMTGDDIKHIRSVAKRSDAFTLLSRSLAPSIYGHTHIKRALALLLVGGAEKNLDNGTHIRGDINVMMVGDPSTAKSQLLRFVLNIAPLAVNTTGRGSSGVGLTAAVTTDPETGDRRLEAGAMVLADRGVVCIDEFDKMSDADRVAIHEVMEQQTVTIAKAGIQAQLNARCSVVAAANPIYGQYDTTASPQYNVNLPDSLLSRFDLLFIVLDSLDAAKDRAVADHVLRMHRYQRPGQEGVPVPLDASPLDEVKGQRSTEDETTPTFQKFNPLLHGGAAAEVAAAGRRRRRGGATAGSGQVELLNAEFIKKYIHFAKNRPPPQLSSAARDSIASFYNQIRQAQDQARSMPVTARALETLIRLSTAHAKLRLSKSVDEDDVTAAFDILKFALYDNAQPTAGKGGKSAAGEDDGEAELGDTTSDSDSDGPEDGASRPAAASKSPAGRVRSRRLARPGPASGVKTRATQSQEDTEEVLEGVGQWQAGEGGAAATSPTRRSPRGARAAPGQDTATYKEAVKVVSQLFRKAESEVLSVEDVGEALTAAGAGVAAAAAGDGLQTLLQRMHDENKVFLSEGVVFKI